MLLIRPSYYRASVVMSSISSSHNYCKLRTSHCSFLQDLLVVPPYFVSLLDYINFPAVFWSHLILVCDKKKKKVNQPYGVNLYYTAKKGLIKAIVTAKLLGGFLL